MDGASILDPSDFIRPAAKMFQLDSCHAMGKIAILPGTISTKLNPRTSEPSANLPARMDSALKGAG